MEEPDIIEDFYGVYLLYCMNEKYLGRTYIGYTVDPNRRISQHNKGVWAGGARKTNNKGPWKMVMIIHGFPNNISALRFEWAWQNPELSRRFTHVTNKKKMRNEKALAYRLRILAEMLVVGPWNRLPLTVRWLAEEFAQDFPPNKLPPFHMPICYGPVKSKKKKKKLKSTLNENDESSQGHSKNKELSDKKVQCLLCFELIQDQYQLSCVNQSCELICHINCLAELFLTNGEYVPIEGDCPLCCKNLLWGDLIRKMNGCNDTELSQESQSEDDHPSVESDDPYLSDSDA